MRTSIVIPVHNEEKTLKTCLTSAIKQKNCIIIIVLDRCKDRSKEIAQSYQERYGQIEIYELKKHSYKHGLYAGTVNYGASKVKTEYFCILDSDTALNKDYVIDLLPYLNQKIVCVGGKLVTKNKHEFVEGLRGTGRVINKNVWDKVGGFKDILACDTYFDFELENKGYKTKLVEHIYQFDLRNYSKKNLLMREIKRGRARRQLGQSFPFMVAHGLKTIIHIGFFSGVQTLVGNSVGYLQDKLRAEQNYIKQYEKKKILAFIGLTK
jgi:cellulose synthase/poly-beta-1,6-N-acetylglucosamine synthase-like glycosyltransferase